MLVYDVHQLAIIFERNIRYKIYKREFFSVLAAGRPYGSHLHYYTALVSIFLPPLLLLLHFSDWEKGKKFGYLLLLPRPTAGIYTIHYAMAASSHVRHTLDRDCCTISISLPTNTHTHSRHTLLAMGMYEFDSNLFFFFFY